MNDAQADNLIQRFLADEATPELIDELDAWLREDPANARTLAEYGLLEQLMVGQQVEDDASSVLALLLELEENAQPIELTHTPEDNQDRQPDEANKKDPAAMSGHQVLSITGYLIGQALISKPAILAYAAAAVLLITALLIPWNTSTNTPMPTASENPMPWDNNETTTPPTVATLTAQHNAAWAEPASVGGTTPINLTPGTALTVGQRLTLTQGFAEITTTRGAVAMIYAPCTIEFTDNDNAIRLHNGKLNGLCETKSSKGFLVHTPHMQVIDLGTRFSVQANADATEVYVIEGEIQAARVDAAGQSTAGVPFVLAEGQGAALANGKLVRYRSQHLLAIDFQHTGAKVDKGPQPDVGVTQPGYEAFDETRFAEGNRATFSTDVSEITVTLTGLESLHNGYFTRPTTPAAEAYPGVDLYNDHIFDNSDGQFTLTLTGPGIVAGQTYDLSFYSYDPGVRGWYHGVNHGVRFAGIDGTSGQAGPINYTVGTHPSHIDQYKATASFVADEQGRLTIEASDTVENNEKVIRLCAIEIVQRVSPNKDTLR